MDASLKKIDFRSLYYFVVFYLIIFGPKIGAVFDVSVCTSGLILLSFVGRGVVCKYARTLIVLICFMILYILGLSLFSNTDLDYIFLFKFVRSLFALLCISNLIEFGKIGTDKIRNVVVNVLLVHALVVVVESLFWIDLQNILRPLSGFDRYPGFFRATGFTNGYDFAGLICIFGLILSYVNNFSPYKIIIFVVATLLTSRMNMIVLEIVLLYLILFVHNENRFNKMFLIIFLVMSIFPVLGVFLFTTKNEDNMIVNMLLQNDSFAKASNQFVYYYASSEIESSLNTHYNFSRLTDLQFIFGSLQSAEQDPGYTQYIYKVGLVGVFVVLVFYVRILVQSLKLIKKEKKDALAVVLISILCVVMSVKNSYLLARHVTEILFVVYSILCYNNKHFVVAERICERKKNNEIVGIRNSTDI